MFAMIGGLWLQFTPTAHAAINPTINFQGKLTNPDGTNVTNGNYSIRFRIYTDPTADTADPCANSCLWEETQATVAVNDGIFRVALGSVASLPGSVNFNLSALYLSMKVGVDPEMSPRIQLTASPYAFNSDAIDGLDSTNLVQLGQGTQTDSSTTNASLSINKTGGTALIFDVQRSGTAIFQLANNGSALFRNQADSSIGFQIQSQSSNPLLTVDTSAANVYIGNPAADNLAAQLVVDTKNTSGDPTGVNGGIYYNSNGGTFRCFQSGVWSDCLTSGNSTASFTSGLANVGANVTGAAVETLIFTTATAVSNTAGITGFTAPAGGSFRTCLIKNNANVTGGTLSLRWRVNGASVGAGACEMSSTVQRESATALDPGVVTFSAGDTIGIAFDSVGLAPTTNDFTVYWTVEYNSTTAAVSGATLQSAYGNDPSIDTTDTHNFVINATDTATDANVIVNLQCTTACGGNGRFAVQNGGADVFAVGPTGGITIGNTSTSLTIENGTGVAALFDGATAHTVQFATGAAAQSVTIGSTNTTSALTLNAGSGDVRINATNGDVILQTTTAGTINLVPAGTSNILLGTSDTTGTLLVLDTKTSAGDPTGVNGGQYYNSNLGKFRCYQNGIWEDCISKREVSLAADVTNNNVTANTIADVTGLSFPVSSGVLTSFECTIWYTAAATTTGSRWSINGPATTALAYQTEYSLTTTTSTRNAMLTAYNSPAASNASSATTGGNMSIIKGIIVPSAGGNVIVRFASEVSLSAIVAKAGSNCQYW